MLQRLDLRGHTGDLRAVLPRPDTGGAAPVAAVADILAGVRRDGDAAVRGYTQRFDGVDIDELRVPPAELGAALDTLAGDLRAALEAAHDGIADFHRHQAATTTAPARYERGGIAVDTVFRPVERAGCYVPGGRAVYPSSVLMTAVIAKVAGVGEVALCVPPGADGHVPAITLAAAALAGVDEVYRIGGAQAIGAMAYGTESIRPVDVIVGPGNVYVALAKQAVAGVCAVPSAFAGPSEIVVIADDTTPPALAAVDLLVQAEHGPLGQSWLLTWSETAADAIVAEVERQVAVAPRRADIEATFATGGHVVLCASPEQAAAVSDVVAPEHLQLMCAEPESLVPLIHHAGAVFCGPWAPASVGDYLAGPSHVLPTAGTARFSSALTVRDFVKEMHVVTVSEPALAAVAPHVAALATAEGLVAHAESVTRRNASAAPAEVTAR